MFHMTTTVQTTTALPEATLTRLRSEFDTLTDDEDAAVLDHDMKAEGVAHGAVAGMIRATATILGVSPTVARFVLEGDADPAITR